MDSRVDPLGVCAHRSSFSDARSRVNQSRPSTFKQTNAVISSEGEADLHQIVLCDTDNVQDAVFHIAGAIVGGSISTISPDADRSSPAVILPEVFILPKRSRSCDGRVETSATVTRYIQESGARRTRGANTLRKNDLRERDVNAHSSDLKSQKRPDLPQSEPDDGRSVETDDDETSHKTPEVKIYMAQDQSTQTEPIQTLLDVLPTFESIGQPCVSISSSPTLIGTKGNQKEEEDFWAPRSKRRRQDTEDVKPVLHTRYVVGDADISSHRASSIFDASGWSKNDWFFADSQYHSPSSNIGFDASRSKDRSDGQLNLRPRPKRSSASAPNSLGRSEDLSQVFISASPFDYALDIFNQRVLNCDPKNHLPNIDAMKRFQDEPACCLANTTKGPRCNNRIGLKKDQQIRQQRIRQLLKQLAAMDIKSNRPKCVIEKFRTLIELTICRHQCKKLQGEVDQLVLPDPPKASARLSAGPIREKDTTKVKIEEAPSSPCISDSNRTSGGQDLLSFDTPSVTSEGKITIWWRKPQKGALKYLPDYRPYQSASSYQSNVEDWVMKQAAMPLTVTELDEGYLYVYWNQATFGVCKIGYTCKDVSKRLRNWESQCKHIAEEQYRSSFKVRNVKRVERLVHAELKDYRVKEHGCHGCSRNHKEWFEGVGLDIIRESIEFWTEWMERGQYEEAKGKWRLKKGARKELSQLCTKLAVINARESKEKSTTISPPRYNLRPRSATRSPSYRSRRL